MSHLYVVEFSSGHIKVGRSIDPKSRIAQHEARVACLGAALLNWQAFECTGNVARAESMLIEWCRERATERFKSEWFLGLRFECVTTIAGDIASLPLRDDGRGCMNIFQSTREALNLSQEELGTGLGLSQGAISHWECDRTTPTPEQARKLIEFAVARGVKLSFDDIYAATAKGEASPA